MLLSGLYVAFAHSCMTMQMSKRQTVAYFEEAQHYLLHYLNICCGPCPLGITIVLQVL